MAWSDEEKLRRVPMKPGVYLLQGEDGKPLYVGKANKLRARLRSHFKPGKNEDRKHRLMMSKVVDFSVIETDSEVEALILEANFVKEHRPRYNVNLKDDKSFPYIRVTHEPFPRIFLTRKVVRDGSLYFGPYTNAGMVRKLMRSLRRIFPVRTCKFRITEKDIEGKKHKVCLNHHIGRCRGACEGMISRASYGEIVEEAVSFIRGKSDRLIKSLRKKMQDAAVNQQYEEAAQIRDQIDTIQSFQSRQKVIDVHAPDRDIVTVSIERNDACGVVFNVRDGKITNRIHYYLQGVEGFSSAEVLASFIKQVYIRIDFLPGEILVPEPPHECSEIENWLGHKRGRRVHVVVPKKGEKVKLVSMCTRNARLLLDELLLQKTSMEERVPASVKALQEDLRLPKCPRRIEAFDVSNTAGQDPVASMVVFQDGKPLKSAYRKYKIKDVHGIDDYSMIAQVVTRRLRRIYREGAEPPDLILVDGGKGQVSAVMNGLKTLSIEEQAVIGLAKRLEEVFIPGISDPQTLSKASPSLRLLQRVRDEAHRFAVTYHRTLRNKRMVASELDLIPGIGEIRKKALLNRFGSLKGIQNASVNEMISLPGMNRKAAEAVHSAFQKR